MRSRDGWDEDDDENRPAGNAGRFWLTWAALLLAAAAAVRLLVG